MTNWQIDKSTNRQIDKLANQQIFITFALYFVMMKIFSYNVNGIRAAMTKGFVEWLTAKKGYSGVAILSKTKPKHVEVGAGIDYMDKEGRILRADYEDFSVMSLYLPSGTNIDRLDHKLQFMADFQEYINKLKQSYPNLIICGDYNICHEAIDIHDPVRNANVSGFLPVERKWLDNFLKSGFIDSFRFFNKEPHNYSWWSYRANARNNNKGWRIDYCLVAQPLESRLVRAAILPEAKHSDHCPILVEIKSADEK